MTLGVIFLDGFMREQVKRMPIVKQETVNSLGRSLIEGEDGNFNADVFQLIREENPILASFIEKHGGEAIRNQYNFNTVMTEMLTCCCIMYLLLRNQAEADEMNEMFG